MAKSKRPDRKAETRPRNATETRRRILEAAKVRFSRAGYDQIGVRDIAADAGVDPALVARYFQSKEGLFEAVVAGAFTAADLFTGPPKTWGEAVARHLMGRVEGSSWTTGFDPFQLLLRSAVSPVASAMVAHEFHTGFVGPLAARLGAPEAEIRAVLITASIIGFALLRVALQSPAVETADPALVTKRLAAAIQQHIDGAN